MLVSLALTALFTSLLVRADPNPTAPGPGDSFNEGSDCSFTWDVDASGVWKSMKVQLMTGSNTGMIPLTTVVTLDGTDATLSPYTYPCPEVTPNAPIYFYQFTSTASKNTLWTTRFTIADSTGASVPAPNATQPDGQAIPWGIGSLAGAADNSSTVAPVSSTTSSTSASASSLSSVSGSSTSSSHAAAGTSKASSVASSGTAAPSSTSTNGATGGLIISSRVLEAGVALGVAAIGFTVLL